MQLFALCGRDLYAMSRHACRWWLHWAGTKTARMCLCSCLASGTVLVRHVYSVQLACWSSSCCWLLCLPDRQSKYQSSASWGLCINPAFRIDRRSTRPLHLGLMACSCCRPPGDGLRSREAAAQLWRASVGELLPCYCCRHCFCMRPSAIWSQLCCKHAHLGWIP